MVRLCFILAEQVASTLLLYTVVTGSEYWKQFPATCGPLIDLFIDVKIFYGTKFPSFYVAPVFTLSYGCVLDRSFELLCLGIKIQKITTVR